MYLHTDTHIDGVIDGSIEERRGCRRRRYQHNRQGRLQRLLNSSTVVGIQTLYYIVVLNFVRDVRLYDAENAGTPRIYRDQKIHINCFQ